MRAALPKLLSSLLLIFLLQISFVNAQITTSINNVTLNVNDDTICIGNTVTLTTNSSQTDKFYSFRNNSTGAYLTAPTPGTGSPMSYTTSGHSNSTNYAVYAEHLIEGLHFDGTNDYISTSLNLSASGTWEAWIQKTNWANHHDDILISNGMSSATNGTFYISLHPQGAHFRYGGTSEAGNNYILHNASLSFAANSWHHFAATWEQTSGITILRLYVDGTLLSNQSASLQLGTIGNIKIGGDGSAGTNSFGEGSMRDVRFYNSVRSVAEIAGDYKNRLNGMETGLIGLYKLNENGGSAAKNEVSITTNGTLTNMNTPICWHNNGLVTAPLPSTVVSNTVSVVVNPTIPTTTVTATGYYTWPVNNKSYNTSGTYTALADCKNYTLNLTINAMPNRLIVVNTNDSGPGSLRAAIETANADTGADTIIFRGINYPATITLSAALSITKDLVILGPGMRKLTVSGNNTCQGFLIDYHINAVIKSLAIKYAFSVTGGVAIQNLGVLTIDSLAIENCSANSTLGPYDHASIILNSGNFRGYTSNCKFYMDNCVFQNNTGEFRDLGIIIHYVTHAVIQRSYFEGNDVIGLISNNGTIKNAYNGPIGLVVSRCRFTNNFVTKYRSREDFVASIFIEFVNGPTQMLDLTTSFYSCYFEDNNVNMPSFGNNGVTFDGLNHCIYFKNCVFNGVSIRNYMNIKFLEYNIYTSNHVNVYVYGLYDIVVMLGNTGAQIFDGGYEDLIINQGDANVYQTISDGYTISHPLSDYLANTDRLGNPLVCNADRGDIEDQTPQVLPVITVSSKTDVSCHGLTDGAASITSSNSALLYSWSPSAVTTNSISNLSAGSYKCTATDAAGCQSTESITIEEPEAIAAAVTSKKDVSCHGTNNGSIALSTNGGTGNYSYTWTPANAGTTASVSNLTAGNYNCVIKDENDCQVSKDITINDGNAFISSQNVNLCFGTSVTVGTSTYTTSGTYTNVLTSSEGCDSTVTTIVNRENALNIATTLNGSIISASATGVSYQWINALDNSIITNETNRTFSPDENGNYAVIITKNSCADTSAAVAVNLSVSGINNTFNEIYGVSVYPNPGNGNFTVDLSGVKDISSATVEVTDALGMIIIKRTLPEVKTNMNLEGINRGVYYVKILTAKGQNIQKIIVSE